MEYTVSLSFIYIENTHFKMFLHTNKYKSNDMLGYSPTKVRVI